MFLLCTQVLCQTHRVLKLVYRCTQVLCQTQKSVEACFRCSVVLKRVCCFLMIRVRQSGALWVMLSHMSTTCLLQGDLPILHLFVDALQKEWEITQSKIIGPSKEGEITHAGMWTAAMSGGGFGIYLSYVSDVLKSWDVSECRRATTFGSHDSWKQQVSTVRFLSKSHCNQIFVWPINVLVPCCGFLHQVLT